MSAILCSLLSARPWPLAEPISTSQMMSGHHSALRAPPDPTYLLGEQTQPLLHPLLCRGSTRPWEGGLYLLALAGWEQEPISCLGRTFCWRRAQSELSMQSR